MTLPSYQIQLIDPATGLTTIVFEGAAVDNMKYSRTLNGIGVIAITFPGISPVRPLCNLDTMIEVSRTSPITGQLQLEETYLARYFHRFRTGDTESFVVGGVSLNHLISRRLVNPIDDPAQAGGFSTKAGAADTIIRQYCLEQMGPSASVRRQFPGLTIPPVIGTGFPVGARLRFDNLLTAIQDLAVRGNTDFQIVRGSGANLILNVGVIGANKTKTINYPWNQFVQLDPRRGNMQDPSYQVDRRDEQTYVYCQSQGQGENRTTLELQGDSALDSPFNLIEFTYDARNTQTNDVTGLLTQARVGLQEKLPQIEFVFTPLAVAPGSTYRLDWDVGDRITATWDNITQDLRVVGVEITISDQGESIKTNMVRYDT